MLNFLGWTLGLSALTPFSPYRSEPFTAPCFTAGVEGPAVGPDGTLYVVNFERPGTIGAVDARGECRLFLELPAGSVGNGMRFGPRGELLIADYKGHHVFRYDFGTQTLAVLAYEERFSQPNDLVVTRDGFVYASDPDWRNSGGKLWRISPEGHAEILEMGMGTTNGIETSPDERYLYVNESAQLRVWRYELRPDRALANKTLFHQFEGFEIDGMRTDARGRLFVTRYGKGTIAILGPDGQLEREVTLVGRDPSNLTFDGRRVYVTMQDGRRIERFDAEYPGRE